MKEHRHEKGRWVILLDEGIPPMFWSFVREDLERVCAVLRRTCPTAQVTWMADAEGGADAHEPRAWATKVRW